MRSDESNCPQAEKPEGARKCIESKNKIKFGRNTTTIVPINFGIKKNMFKGH